MTHVFTPLHSVSCLNSYLLDFTPLSPHPFPLCFYFIFFSIWLLSLSLNFTSCQVGPNFLVIYSLACIHFQFCFKHMSPCFTTLYNHMWILAIASNFHTFHPRQLNQLYAKEVYFHRFVTKFNQAFTKYSLDVFNIHQFLSNCHTWRNILPRAAFSYVSL